MQYLFTHSGDQRTVTLFTDEGEVVGTVGPGHLSYDKIMDHIDTHRATGLDDALLRKLLRPADPVAERLAKFSDRFEVINNQILLDGHMLGSLLTAALFRVLKETETSDADVRAWVNFAMKVVDNPSRTSGEALVQWVNGTNFTITPDGDVIGYKGVAKDGNGNFVSVHSGPADIVAVDGVLQPAGQVPNPVGAVITMERRYVDDNRNNHCSQGLHVGQYSYARSFGHGALLKVSFDPKDVVSVPPDSNAEKMRVCRYKVLETTEYAVTAPVDYSGYDNDYEYDEDDVCEDCGEYTDECTCDDCPDCGEHVDECTCDDCPDCGERYEDCTCDEDDEDEDSGLDMSDYTPHVAANPNAEAERQYGTAHAPQCKCSNYETCPECENY